MRGHGNGFIASDLFIQPGLVLTVSKFAVAPRGLLTHAGRQQAHLLGMQHQPDVADVVLLTHMGGCKCQHQKLHRELCIHHAAYAVFEVESAGGYRIRIAQFVAHGDDFSGQAMRLARCAQHLATHRVKGFAQARVADAKPRPRQGLVFP